MAGIFYPVNKGSPPELTSPDQCGYALTVNNLTYAGMVDTTFPVDKLVKIVYKNSSNQLQFYPGIKLYEQDNTCVCPTDIFLAPDSVRRQFETTPISENDSENMFLQYQYQNPTIKINTSVQCEAKEVL